MGGVAVTAVVEGAVVYPGVRVGKYTYLGPNSRIVSGQIGAFCSLAWNVTIGAGEHPLDAASTHSFWYMPKTCLGVGHDQRQNYKKPAPVIGSDVWIGAGATVLRGAVIDDGAVIGAGSVVTGHIPRYAIAVGVPARVIRYRFDEGLCEALRATRWWDWDDVVLREAYPLFQDVSRVLEFARRTEGKQE